MDDKFELPPRRELPEDIKDRMRATVRMRMDDPEFEPHGRGRRFLAAAAGILVVAVGVGVVMQSMQDDGNANDPGKSTTPSPSGGGFQSWNQSQADRHLVDRCWRAAMSSPQASQYPARREEWQGGRQMVWSPIRQIGLRLGDKVAACELSDSTVWLSEPQTPLAPEDPTPFKLMMMTPNGGSAVNVRHGVAKLVVGVDQSARGGPKNALEPFDLGFGVRGGEPRNLPQGGKVHIGVQETPTEGNRFRDVDYPNPVGPLVTKVDNPLPPGERTSVAGRKLAECIDIIRTQQFTPAPDAEALVPGAYAEYAPGRWGVAARSGTQAAFCGWDAHARGWRLTTTTDYRLRPEDPARLASFLSMLDLDLEPMPSAKEVMQYKVAGFSGTVADHVAQLSIALPDGPTVQATISNGTYLVKLPRPVDSGALRVDRVTYTAKDSSGKVIGSGKLFN